MRKQEYKEQEQKRPRRYYFFDYLFWLGEITWLNYHTYDIKQPNGNEMLVVCSVSFIFIPILTIVGHFLYDYDRSIFEFFSLVLLIVWIVAIIMKDRLLGKIYPPSRRKAVMQHYEGRKFSQTRCYFFFFTLILLFIPELVLLSTVLKWITGTMQ